ncbi:hypothetical protein TBLA_0C04670 [Henningerozyma blattae CBS 6284]|uniref:Respiratory growth induced protein 1 n=1 Tax=Henningerozyma blattae (strain ATCC 34711 / CBS 6284 / DSM 70876 / NBRC 10599 / NRRL Y-10934 / UCD 77-7) TaxID=1071380 RepID=I2H1L1_HENB6|nr:hypothetical protein TBLA_0C04670 [Tetrapisispora blattae CBS 6284]CCH60263.1 hypothetical protein TBLA_0C04670 [Tetrapisispora blattae CBS 6284]
MPKKDKKKAKTYSTITTKSGETLKVFEDLEDFNVFLKNGAEDDEYDNIHCQLKYYPPFVLAESHNDPEKIKDTANSNSKKFVRHLNQHVEKHLLKDIRNSLDLPDLKFKDKSKEKTNENMIWNYSDVSQSKINHKKFKIDIRVTANHYNAMVDVDYKTVPIAEIAMEPENTLI